MLKGFCCFFWMLKVLAHTFGCWRFFLLLFDVKGYYFYSWMFKVLTLTLGYWRFLLLLVLCYRVELSLCFNPSTSKLCTQGKIFSKST
jgi:hypothetical protein